MASAQDVREAYLESLANLTFNSRPVIMNLTELANEYKSGHAPLIVKLIEERLKQVSADKKLPCLYLMDSIVKNHPQPYRELFQNNLVASFCHVFAAIPDVGVRMSMHKLRQTWNEVFPPARLQQLDVQVKRDHDPKWPVSNPVIPTGAPNIHINPAVFNRNPRPMEDEASVLERELKRQQLELMKLKKQKLDLEMENARKDIEEATKARASIPAVKSTNVTTTQVLKGTSSVGAQNSKDVKGRVAVRDPRIRSNTETPKKPSDEATMLREFLVKDVWQKKSPAKEASKSPVGKSEVEKDSSPPPPPTIRGDFKGSKTPIKPVSVAKSPKDESKNRSVSRKRINEESGSRGKRDVGLKQQRLDKGHSPSSSPSPPPLPVEKKKFRIPKKGKHGADHSPMGTAGYSEEGPHVEFNKGKRMENKAGGKRSGGNLERNSPSDKKSKLNQQLFGDNNMRRKGKKGLHQSPSAGWAKFKESNPDEFRTPLQNSATDQDFNPQNDRQFQQRNSAEFGRLAPGGSQMQGPHVGHQPRFRPNVSPFLNPNNVPLPSPQNLAMSVSYTRLFRHVSDTDPHIVETEIIPQIITQAQEGLRDGKINQLQFSDLMKQVLILKEQAMMKQADRRHLIQLENKENRQGGRPWVGMPPVGLLPPSGPPRMGQLPPQGPMPFPVGGPPMNSAAFPAPIPDQRQQFFNRDLPIANEEDLVLIKHDPIKSINIDNHPRDIRFYEETATCVMAENDIRELSFQRHLNLPSRRVFIDDNPNIVPPLQLDVKDYTDFVLDGVKHKIKIGAPTRELWVDGQWFECYFDKHIRIRIGQNFHSVFLEGPPPNVKIGDQRSDLCAGFVNLIIDAELHCQKKVFLDAKPQQLDIEGKPHVLRFVEGLRTLLINGHPFRADFGGMPFVIYVNGNKHYLRLTSLPRGVHPGRVNIWNMMPPAMTDDVANRPKGDIKPASPPSMTSNNENSHDGRFDSEGHSSAFDHLLKLFPSTDAAKRDTDTTSESDYNIKGTSNVPAAKPVDASGDGDKGLKAEPSAATNVHDLWTQLLGAGLVATPASSAGIPGLEVAAAEEKKAEVKAKEPEKEKAVKEEVSSPVTAQTAVEPIVLKSHHKSIKQRQQGIINQLYDPSALQCKNCGLRYISSEMIAYSQHLDWHFRMKRREKDNARRAQSRKWYFERIDWIISEEIEDEDKDALADPDSKTADGHASPSEIPTVPVSDNSKETNEGTCPICHEEFDQFFKEDGTDDADDGRWHYRNAIRPPTEDQYAEEGRGRVYHPQCYQDRQLNASGALEESVTNEDVSMDDVADGDQSLEKKEDVKDEEEAKVEEMDANSTDLVHSEEALEEKEKMDVDKETEIPLIKREEEVLTESAETVGKDTDEKAVSNSDMDIVVKTEVVEEEIAAEPQSSAEVAAVKAEPDSGETVAESDSETAKTEVNVGEETTEAKPAESPVKTEPETATEPSVSAGSDSAVAAVKVEPTETEIKTESETDLNTESEPAETEAKPESEPESPNLEESAATAMTAPMPAKANISLNITSQFGKLERLESVASSQSETEESEFDTEAIVQEAKPEQLELKPKLKGRKLTVFPMQNKDTELSGLCSIM